MFLEKYAPKRVHLILFCCSPLLCFIFSQKQLDIRTNIEINCSYHLFSREFCCMWEIEIHTTQYDSDILNSNYSRKQWHCTYIHHLKKRWHKFCCFCCGFDLIYNPPPLVKICEKHTYINIFLYSLLYLKLYNMIVILLCIICYKFKIIVDECM